MLRWLRQKFGIVTRPDGQRCLGCEHYCDFDIPDHEKDEDDRLNKCYLRIDDDEYGGPWFHENEWCPSWCARQDSNLRPSD